MVGPDAFAGAIVEIVGARGPVINRRIPHGIQDGPVGTLWAHAQFTAHRVISVGAERKILVLLEMRKDRIPAPAFQPELTPVIKVPGLAADLDHPID